MTWLSTWLARPPGPTVPQYAEHPTESAAEAHAKWLIDSNASRHATFYEITEDET